ncbi:hypothetical protein [Neobacillus sp.]|nr:hypothetical protein [Neobacillus sp.]
MSSIKLNLSEVEAEEPIIVKIDWVEFEVPKEKIVNPLATFQGIRFISEV